MHFNLSYVSKTIMVVLLTVAIAVGTPMLSQVYTAMLQYETVPVLEMVTVFLMLVLLAVIIWVTYMLWGLVLRILLWRRALDNRRYKTSHHTSVWMMPGDPGQLSKRALRVRDEDGGVMFCTISRGLDIVEVDGYRLTNREVSALRITIEAMRNNALAYEQASIRL